MCFVYSPNILRVYVLFAHTAYIHKTCFTGLRQRCEWRISARTLRMNKKKTYASARAGLVYYTCHRERALLTPNLPTPHSVWRASARSTKCVCFDCCIVATAKFCVCIIMRSNLVRLFVV